MKRIFAIAAAAILTTVGTWAGDILDGSPNYEGDIVDGTPTVDALAAEVAASAGMDPVAASNAFLSVGARNVLSPGSSTTNTGAIIISAASNPVNGTNQNLEGTIRIGSTAGNPKFNQGGIYIGNDIVDIASNVTSTAESIAIGHRIKTGTYPAWSYENISIGNNLVNPGHAIMLAPLGTGPFVGYGTFISSAGFASALGSPNIAILESGGISLGCAGTYNTALGFSANINAGDYNFWHSWAYSPLFGTANIGIGYPNLGNPSHGNIGIGNQAGTGPGVGFANAMGWYAMVHVTNGVAVGTRATVTAGASNSVALGPDITNSTPDSTALKGNTWIFENGAVISNDGVNLFFRNLTGGVWRTGL